MGDDNLALRYKMLPIIRVIQTSQLRRAHKTRRGKKSILTLNEFRMKHFFYAVRIALLGIFLCVACKTGNKTEMEYLASWKDTEIKQALIKYLDTLITDVPIEYRVATFDMDGTIACESPLWMEMYCAVQGLCDQVTKDSSLLALKIYQYAEKLKVNPHDTSVTNNYGPLIDSMINTAFLGQDNEYYIDFCNNYLSTNTNVDYGMPLSGTFYQPMLELLTYLKDRSFDVYIVSGSRQGLVWSVCPEIIHFERSNLIGTRQQMTPSYSNSGGLKMILENKIFQPKNGGNGKTQNIYNQIGKVPIFAFGNTTDDFGMLHMASSSEHPNMALLLNHDDSLREYAYNPWHGNIDPVMAEHWKDTMKANNWCLVNMSMEFDTVFMK